MNLSSRSVLLTASLLISLPALAYDWDWDDEIASREWRAETLEWASSLHSETPSPLLLMATTAPPPRELWCDVEVAPTMDDCMIFDSKIEDWVRDYLQQPHHAPISAAVFSTFPAECAASCQVLSR